jgi:AraC-like DNA-binding protein
MKAVYEQVHSGKGQSIHCKKIALPCFDAPFHFHPEYELTLILKGEGMRYVGMQAEAFRAGDLVLLGPNLPHCWLNNPEEDGSDVEACVIQFDESLLQDSILKWPEFHAVAKLLHQSKGGLALDSCAGESIPELLREASRAQRIILFLNLLLQLADKPYRTLIETEGGYEDQQRFKVVFGYLVTHFREPVSLEKIAGLVGLTPTSFCRYFKKMTGKTLFDIVLQYRLEAAAQLLVRTAKPVNEVAFESGFENAPYFNRTFKKWKGVSPRVFRNQNCK